MFTKLKFIIAGVLALATVTIIGLGYRHYTGLLETVSVLTENNTKLTTAVDLQRTTIAVQGEAIGEWQSAQGTLVARMEELQRVAHKATKETRRLNGIFARNNLTELAVRRPGLIERRINTGTARIGCLLERASGAERTDCPD